MNIRLVVAAALATACAIGATRAHAQNWLGVTGTYNSGSGWSTGLVPTAVNAPIILQNSWIAPTLTASATASTITIQSNMGLWALPGGSLRLNSTGIISTGALIGSGTSLVSAALVLGAAGGSTQGIWLTGSSFAVLGGISETNAGTKLRIAGNDQGNWTMYLSGPGNWSGGTDVGGGTLNAATQMIIDHDQAFGSGTVSLVSAAGFSIRSSSRSIRQLANPLSIQGGISLGSGTTGAIVFTSPTVSLDLLTGTSVLRGSGAGAILGVIGDGGQGRSLNVGQLGSGGYLFLLGVNTYEGQTVLAGPSVNSSSDYRRSVGHTLVINSIGNFQESFLGGSDASSLGKPSSEVNATLAFTGADSRLRYIGGEGATNRGISGAVVAAPLQLITLDASGRGRLTYSGSIGISGTSNGLFFRLDGTNRGENTLGTILRNSTSGSAVQLAKVGAGTWWLNQSNTFTGTTVLHGGRLVLDHADTAAVLSVSSTISFRGGTLEILGSSSVARTVALGNLSLGDDHTNNRPRGPGSGGSVASIDLVARGGQALTVNTGTWNRPTFDAVSAGGLVHANLGGNTLTAAAFSVNAGLQNGILIKGYATVTDTAGTGFATWTTGTINRYTGGTEFGSATA